MMPIRICRDCQHHDPDSLLCQHPKAINTDLVTGHETRMTSYKCRIWRCGPEGKLWEPWPDVQKQLDQIDSVVDALVNGVR